MKKVVFGGLLFIGGAIMFSFGVGNALRNYLTFREALTPHYIGIVTMLVGAALGLWGLIKD